MITVTIQHDDPRMVRKMMQDLLGTSALSSEAPNAPTISTPNTGAASPASPTAPMPVASVQASADNEDDDAGAPVSTASADSTGMPWDERIHSAARSTNADGTWRKRKGIDKTIIPGIEAELRAQGASSAPAPAPTPQPAPLPPPKPIAAPLPVPTPQPASAPVTPPPPPMPAPAPEPVAQSAPAPTPPAAPTTPAAVPSDFHGFMQHLSVKMTTPGSGVTPDYLASLAQRIGAGYGIAFNAVTDLQEQPQYIGYAVQLMQHDGTW
jgi:hypothetical protein